MRRWSPVVLAAAAAAIPCSCGGEPATQPPPRPRLWYSGGTAHNADAARWKEVEPRNRLATCADLVTTALIDQGVNPGFLDIEKLKPWAMELETCISEAFEAGHDGRVPEVAAECLGEMDVRWPP